jgi:hypothetical protein
MHPNNALKFRLYENASRIPNTSKARVVTFQSLQEKARFLDSAASLDALRTDVQDYAKRFISFSEAEARTRAIQRWVRDNIQYQYDYRTTIGRRGEEFADSSTLIKRGFGDCDDKARIFVALVRAIEMVKPLGARARIRPIFTKHPYEFVHVQAEVKWPRSVLHENSQGPKGWLLAELILKDCEIGQNPDTVPRLPNGERAIV